MLPLFLIIFCVYGLPISDVLPVFSSEGLGFSLLFFLSLLFLSVKVVLVWLSIRVYQSDGIL